MITGKGDFLAVQLLAKHDFCSSGVLDYSGCYRVTINRFDLWVGLINHFAKFFLVEAS